MAIEALHRGGHDVRLVLTQPDRPGGRGLKPVESAVKRYAVSHSLPVFQPASLKSEDAARHVATANAEALIVAAYGLILPQAVLDLFPRGAWNIHASLLPRWRGAAPIQRAILAGDAETGISIMRMEAGLDTGPVLAREAIPILPDDDAGSLHDRLAFLGARMMLTALQLLDGPSAPAAQPQPALGVTYAAKIDKSEARLDWRRSAVELERVVRASRPVPGATTLLDGQPLKIWRARAVEGTAEGGSIQIAGDALLVGTGEGRLAVEEVQRPGGRRLGVQEFLRGHPLPPHAKLS